MENIYIDGGNLEILFDTKCSQVYYDELITVTKLVDKHAKFEVLNSHKQIIKQKIIEYEKIIKSKYPEFLRSKKFKEFDRYIKKTDAKYLLKYDRVKLVTGWFFKKDVILSVNSLEKDFPDMPQEYAAYIRLNSCRRKQARISSKINRLSKYYSKPAELFARFVEGLYLYPEKIQTIAPHSYNKFYKLLNSGYYMELSEVFKILKSHNFVE